jgi:hypothetical protein
MKSPNATIGINAGSFNFRALSSLTISGHIYCFDLGGKTQDSPWIMLRNDSHDGVGMELARVCFRHGSRSELRVYVRAISQRRNSLAGLHGFLRIAVFCSWVLAITQPTSANPVWRLAPFGVTWTSFAGGHPRNGPTLAISTYWMRCIAYTGILIQSGRSPAACGASSI